MGEKKFDVIRRKAETRNAESAKLPDDVKKNILLLMEVALKNLLGQPEELRLSIEEGQRTTIFEVDIAQSDFGRLVGIKGRTIGALRTLVAAMAATHNIRAIVRIKDEDRFF